jgi:hypothetical protein
MQVASLLLPIADCQLSIVNCQLPIANFNQLTMHTSFKSAIGNPQSAIINNPFFFWTAS